MSDMSQPPLYVIRTGEGTQGEPYLEVKTTSNYTWLYNDKSTGGDHDVTLYRPNPTDTSYYSIGDYAQNNYNSPTGSSPIVRAVNDDPQFPLIMAPSGYNFVWNDKSSGGAHDGSIWFPVPPDGYLSIGFVGQTGYLAPNDPNSPVKINYACLRKDLCENATAGPVIWNDRGSGAAHNVTLFEINGQQCVFLAQANYNPYSGQCNRLKPMA